MVIDDGVSLHPGDIDEGPGTRDRRVRRRVVAWVVLLVMVAGTAVGVAGWWLGTAPTRATRAALGEQGGIVVVMAPLAPPGGEVSDEHLRLVTLLVRHRIDELGVARAEVVTRGSGAATTITVSLSGVHDEQAARSLARPVSLDFREVIAEELGAAGSGTTGTGTATPPPIQADADSPALRAQFKDAVCTTSSTPRVSVGQDPQDWLIACSQDGTLKYLLRYAAITGDMVASATAVEAASGYEIRLEFDTRGAAALADVSTRIAARRPPQNQLGIVLDSEVAASPYLAQAVLGGTAVITGQFTSEEAEALAATIMVGSVPEPLTVLSVEDVPPV